MSDLSWLALWVAVLLGGVASLVALVRVGLPSTYARDLLHVGASLWLLSWPFWQAPHGPVALVTAVALATTSVPFLAKRVRAARALSGSFAAGDERWTGLVHYTWSYALFTVLGITHAALPAAGALLALSWGDGAGGFVGRRWGRLFFRAPGAKRKSVEGSLTVAAAAAAGIFAAGWWLTSPVPLWVAAAAGAVAALAEALAPRGIDNLLVPAATWLVLVTVI